MRLPIGVTAPIIDEGQQIFTQACFLCHGESAEGTPMAPNLTDAECLHGDGSYEFIVELVSTGVPQPRQSIVPMLPRGGSDLTDDQVRAVAAYVWSLSRER